MGVVFAVDELPIQQEIYFTLKAEDAAADHYLALDNFLYFESQLAVDLYCQWHMVDDMIFVEYGDIVQPSPAGRQKLIKCLADEKHVIHHRIIQLLYANHRIFLILL